MNVLFVCHRFPFPPKRGGKIRPFQMIRHLSEKHQVTVASLAHTQEELNEGAGLSDYCEEILAVVEPSLARWRRAALALPTSRPSSAEYFWSPRLKTLIDAAAQRKRFDLIWVHCAFVARYVDHISAATRILDYGDLDSGKWFEYASYRPFPLSLGYNIEARKLRRYEIALARRFDHCTFTAPGELKEFQSWGLEVPSTVIPNGVDFEYFKPLERLASGASPTIAFLGRMDYFPNVQGIIDFTRNVFPRIRQQVPDANLRIIGANPTSDVVKLADFPGVTVTGSVPDVRPCLAEAVVAIAPLKIARGTQNKILECMAMGIPVVCSPEASNGVQAVPGEHLLVGRDPQDFASQVIRLLQDQNLRDRLTLAGCQQLRRTHSWPQSMQLLDALVE
ncbi:MAG TPA: TIGR03087 family PEP-CTERM/XrtA system glycosyltransferase, partial [Alphaproteobacteria bacterium]|nr:TIGR03087 family PEP-CTERM/XrtA system glycosyltransferase [Alphaproteobacteria bacterium]